MRVSAWLKVQNVSLLAFISLPQASEIASLCNLRELGSDFPSSMNYASSPLSLSEEVAAAACFARPHAAAATEREATELTINIPLCVVHIALLGAAANLCVCFQV